MRVSAWLGLVGALFLDADSCLLAGCTHSLSLCMYMEGGRDRKGGEERGREGRRKGKGEKLGLCHLFL
jgi:hypothetical protein